MGIFSSIMDKIFRHPAAQASAAPSSGGGAAADPQAASTQPSPAQSAPTSMDAVDVEAVLSVMAQDKGGGGNWRTSIVDLLKVLDLDSSLQARKELAQELNVHAGADGSAEENVALHKAVMKKLQENGGIVPDSLRAA
jgi:hypothetical protein